MSQTIHHLIDRMRDTMPFPPCPELFGIGCYVVIPFARLIHEPYG
jgi:hypothetical protein